MKILAAVVFGTGGALTICCAAALWGTVGIGLGVGLFSDVLFDRDGPGQMNDDPQPIFRRPLWLNLARDRAARAAWNEMIFSSRSNKEMLDRAVELFKEEVEANDL